MMKHVLLVSNRVMHYRVSLYNAFQKRFLPAGWDLRVRANELQRENPYPVQFDFKAMPFRFSAYRSEINRLDPDAVILFLHLKDAIIWPLMHWLRFVKRTPVIFWSKGANLDALDDRLSRLSYAYMHTLADALILYSENEARYVPRIHRHKVFVANNTLNFDDYPDVPESKEQIKASLGLPFEKVVLFTGRMGIDGERKKVRHLIEVFRQIEDEGVGCVIVGSGLPDEARAAMNPKNTRYLGEVYDPTNSAISRLFAMADVFCIPGHVGLGINQAMFWGLPVVTEEGGQPPEIHYLIDGRNGFMVPGNDVPALKDKILLLLRDDGLRRQMGEHARRDIRTMASVGTMFAGFLASLTHAVSTRNGRAA